jgi:hypothetical protein
MKAGAGQNFISMLKDGEALKKIFQQSKTTMGSLSQNQ